MGNVIKGLNFCDKFQYYFIDFCVIFIFNIIKYMASIERLIKLNICMFVDVNLGMHGVLCMFRY